MTRTARPHPVRAKGLGHSSRTFAGDIEKMLVNLVLWDWVTGVVDVQRKVQVLPNTMSWHFAG